MSLIFKENDYRIELRSVRTNEGKVKKLLVSAFLKIGTRGDYGNYGNFKSRLEVIS